VQIGPALSLLDGIQAARWLLEQKCRFHPRTGDGVEALRSYHYEWDADTKSYSRKPEHDWSSHTADAFRYAAVVAKVTMNLMKPAPAPAVVIPSIDSFTLDQLWKYHDEEQSGRERI
jgi:phage terminase large subunit